MYSLVVPSQWYIIHAAFLLIEVKTKRIIFFIPAGLSFSGRYDDERVLISMNQTPGNVYDEVRRNVFNRPEFQNKIIFHQFSSLGDLVTGFIDRREGQMDTKKRKKQYNMIGIDNFPSKFHKQASGQLNLKLNVESCISVCPRTAHHNLRLITI